MNNLTKTINESFIQFAGAVLQSRALVDVRDCIKPSARQVFYCMFTDKFVHSKPFQKTLKAIGSAFRIYIHGDSSVEGIIMRAGQPFAYRYPLVEVEGSYGTLIESGTWAAPRYTAARLSPLAEYLFKDLDKDTIKEWRDNYDGTEQYPSILPSKGFYNLVNGTFGLGVGAASSIPQFNLKELNNALITLINNPDCTFDEIYCAPDFATGGILYNESDVKESIKNGTGFACKLRSVVDVDSKDRCFIVTEIPYGVYTNTICTELEKIVNSEDPHGIERYNDLTGEKPLIKIYLSKKASPEKVLQFLFKNTSLQYYYGINFTMLDQGRFPRVFTWKEMLQAHIDHEKEVYRRGFEYDLRKVEARIHIIDGLLICLASINEVVNTIKSSESSAAASTALQTQFLLSEAQAKAVLDMKLSRLAHLEVKKLETEREGLVKESLRIRAILEDEKLLNQEIINGLREVSEKFGDTRRTKIIQLAETDGSDPIEKKQLSLAFTNAGAVYVSETSSLYTQRRNGVGSKFKLDEGEYVIDNIIGENTDTILFFTSHGNFYHMKMNNFIVDEKQYLSNFISTLPYEHIVAGAICTNSSPNQYILFVTKNGLVKKSSITEYNLKRNAGAIAIKLDEGDEIVSVLFINDEKIGIASNNGNFIMINTSDIRPIGRVARGVIGMKLNESDFVVSAKTVTKDTKELISISKDGYIKRTSIDEFRLTGRATKGIKIQNANAICDFLPNISNNDILIVSSTTQIRIRIQDIPLLSRDSQGVKSIKLSNNSNILKLQAL